MRIVGMGVALGVALLAAGCAGDRVGGVPVVSPVPAPGPTLPSVSDVQSIATAVCGYLPAATMVVDIFASGNAGVMVAEEIAKAICAAATRKRAVRGSVPTVYGVKLRGQFVRR